MPFCENTAFVIFQDMINNILKDSCNKDVIVYIDDVLIYPKTEEQDK
jgi:hypothetical protein